MLASSVESCWLDGSLLTVLKGSVGLLPVGCSYPIVFARSDNSISDIRARQAAEGGISCLLFFDQAIWNLVEMLSMLRQVIRKALEPLFCMGLKNDRLCFA